MFYGVRWTFLNHSWFLLPSSIQNAKKQENACSCIVIIKTQNNKFAKSNGCRLTFCIQSFFDILHSLSLLLALQYIEL